MKLYNKIFAILMVLLFVSSCQDEDRLPIVVLDTVEKGAYPRLIDQTDALLNLFDIAGSTYSYNVEFVDEEGGALVSQYVVDITFDDNNPDNGDNSSGPTEFLRMSADQFTSNERGYLQAPTVTISGTDALSAAGVAADIVKAGDNFNFEGRVELTDGRVFSQQNSSATVVGPSFRGHFNYTMPANCPSDLTGSYAYVTTDAWCGATVADGSVDIVAKGGGTYFFNDWSFGAYACYGAIASQPGINFEEVCAEVAFTAVVDSYGDTWTFDSKIEGNEWTINWVNTYGEAGNSVLFYTGGADWPITLK
ncbi:MAG: hypothetical protein ACJA01_001711 [Saprospiraceae bacterium]|jgi:hypothetical protein